MAKTQREKFIAALTARGYVPQRNPRGSKFIELVPGPEARSLLKANEDGSIKQHRVLIGRAGALRFTTKSIGESIPFSDRTKAKLLDEFNQGATS